MDPWPANVEKKKNLNGDIGEDTGGDIGEGKSIFLFKALFASAQAVAGTHDSLTMLSRCSWP